MAAIAHMVLTAGIDKVLSWTTKPPVVIGEGDITDITITWPTELADYTKYVEFETTTAVSITIDGEATTDTELRLAYTDGMFLDDAIIAGKPKRIWAVAVSGDSVYKSIPLDFPPCYPGITAAAGVVPINSGTYIPMTVATDSAEPTGFLDRTATLAWDTETNAGFSIIGSHSFYISGVKYTKSTTSVTWDPPSDYGLHYFYYAAGGTLTHSTVFPGFNACLVAFAYWTPEGHALVSDERHGITMDGTTHAYLHNTVGVRYESGLAGTFAGNAFSIASGTIWDEDIELDITTQTTCTTLYWAGSFDWRAAIDQTIPHYAVDGTYYWQNGVVLTPCTANKYYATWVFASNDTARPISVLLGQREDNTLANARLNNKYESLALGVLPYKEMKLLYRLIWKGDGTYQEAQDLRAASQHNALAGIDGSGTYHLTAAGAGAAEDAALITGVLKGDGAGNITQAQAGTDYEIAGTAQAHIDDTTDAHDASAISVLDTAGYLTATEVEAALAELGLNSRGVAVADVTLDGAWNDGATVDAGANTITVASATGLANGTPIEFRANTGVLPAGITAYTNGAKGIGDGDYFNIINLSGTTFQICATVGGSTPVDITSAGTAGWQWRVAGATSISATGLSLDTHLEYMAMILTPLARKSSSADSLFIRLNNSTYNQFLWFAYAGSTWGANTTPGPNSQTFTQKYSMNIYLTRIREIESGKLVITSWVSGSESDNRTTATAKTFTGGQALGVYTPQNVTDIYVGTNLGTALIRNGSRIIVVRRGA